MDPAISAQIETAILNQTTKGVTLNSGSFGVIHRSNAYYATADSPEWGPKQGYNGCACALGCVLLEYQPKVTEGESASAYAALARLFGCNLNEIDAFVSGFDGEVRPHSSRDWYNAGLDFARRFLRA